MNNTLSSLSFIRRIGLPGFLILAGILSIFFSISIQHPSYAAVQGFKAGRIIDDTTFGNRSALSVNSIQTFLNAKVPQCDTYGTQPSEFGGGTRRQWAEARGYAPPYTCVRDYNENGKSSAQIIYDTAQEFYINPQVLIVLLQKEQGLITDTWPTSVQYRTATGYGCPDTAACDTQYYGFTNQLRWSAKMFRAIMNASPTWYTPYILGNNYIQYSPVQSCGGSNVYIENRATQALYNYTPYQPNQGALDAGYGTAPCGAYGNRNFYLYFSDWFGSPVGNTSIVKTDGDNAFYLIDGGTKHKIPSMEIYYAYGFEKYPVANVSSTYLSSLTNGNDLSDFVRDSLGAIQLVTGGKRYRIPSAEMCNNWALDCFNPYKVTNLGDIAINLVNYGGDLQPLMANSGAIYKMKDGEKEPYLSQSALFEDGYDYGRVTAVENKFASQPLGVLLPYNSSVLKFNSDHDGVYLYLDKKYYKFESYTALQAWGFEASVVTAPPSQYDSSIPTNDGLISDFIFINNKKYLINNGQVTDLGVWMTEWPTATSTPYLASLLNKYRQYTITPTSSLKTPNGGMYIVEANRYRPFTAPDDFYSLGYRENDIINVNSDALKKLSQGPSIMRSGKLFKRPSNNAIFAVTSKNTSIKITSMSAFWSLRLDPNTVININDVTANAYPSIDISSFVSVNGVQKILGTTSVLYNKDDAIMSQWGIGTSIYSDVSSINNTTSQMNLTRFARNSQGAIYYASGGTKHLISNYNKFIELGGNNYNVMNVFDDFLNAAPTGNSL
jgi:hypothetical protein